MSDELVNSAVTFLQDPKVADAPLAKRIAFLESKGLSSEQVQVALQRAQDISTSNQPAAQSNGQAANNLSYAPSRPPSTYSTYQQQQLQPPPLPQRDWRDWFIMAIVSGGFSWAVYFLAKRYVIPLVSPPTPTQLDTDKENVSAQFDQVQEMLSILQKDTEEIKQHGSEQNKKVETALTNVDEVVQEMKNKTERRENDIRRLGLELEQIRTMVPKAIEAVKTAQSEALTDLNGELRSLKTLLQNRIKATSSSPFSSSTTTTAATSTTAPPPPPSSTTSAAAAPSSLNTAGSTTKTTGTTTGDAGGSVDQVSQSVNQSSNSLQNSSGGKTTVPDPLARFTAGRGGVANGGVAGIPEWQKSAPPAAAAAAAASSDVPAGSVEATATNVEHGGDSSAPAPA